MSEPLVLRPYQARMVRHVIENPFAGLWADMGAGKTAVCLRAVETLIENLDISRVLVVATKRVAKSTWPKEIARWTSLTCRTIEAADLGLRRTDVTVRGKIVRKLMPTATRAGLAGTATVTTISRDLLQYLVQRIGKAAWPWEMVILDESSGFRDHESKRFKAARLLRRHQCAARIVELSGTPAPKGLMNLWAQLYLLDEGARLGRTLGEYRARYFVPDKQDRHGRVFSWKLRAGAAEAIHAAVADICVSLLPEDVVTLPERSFHTIEVELPDDARALYDRMERESLVQVAGADVVALSRANLVGKLLQIASGIAFDDQGHAHALHDAKLDALEELVESLDGRPLLVSYWFRADLEKLRGRFPQAKTLDDGADIESNWNNGDIPILLIHPASGAHGLNLQGNDGHGCWYGPIHDLELYLQLNKRLHRPGRKTPVRIYHLLASDTIDAAVLASLDEKNRSQDNLLRAVRMRIEEMGHG